MPGSLLRAHPGGEVDLVATAPLRRMILARLRSFGCRTPLSERMSSRDSKAHDLFLFRRLSADIEHTARPRNDLIADPQITITEGDLMADATDIRRRLEPVA